MALHAQRQSRTLSTRRTLLGLLLIPLVSLAGLWGFTASVTVGNVLSNQHYNSNVNATGASIIGLHATAQAESALTITWLSSGRRPGQLRTQLLAARRATDSTVAAVRVSTASIRAGLSATGQARLDTFLASLGGLPSIRAAADAGTGSPVTAFTAYTAISTAELGFFRTANPPGDATLSLMTQASLAESRVSDFTSAAVALIEGALASHGQLKQAEQTLLAQVVAEQNLEIGDAFSLATPELTAVLGQAYKSPAYRQLQATESQIVGSPGRPVPVTAATFLANAMAVQAAMRPVQPRLAEALGAQSASLSNHLKTELYLAAGLGLAAVLASVFVAVRFGRRLGHELTSLYDSARQMAEERLPRVVDRLRRGDDIDAEAESPPLRAGRITEIADVARAFSSVQRTAVEAAVGQANLRKGVNQVFVSLSLRNQSLLHRQLGMLDEMERATSDPVVLGDLFRLDHLTTRMRRHAEGLLILAGSTPGRGWRDPVPAADVLNAAVAEVEDYVRVDVVIDSTDAVAGTAVNDVIHLLAELVENATVFSPPKTRVEVRGDSVGHGFAIEVEDRGLGMPAEEIAALNARLANPPEFDLANTDQLGLFVAARLAERHGIKISLRQSPFGGTTAIVLLPPSIIVSELDTGWTPGTADLDEMPWGSAGAPLNGAGGPAHDSHAAGTGGSAPAFGLTGRHRRLGAAAEANSVPGLGLVPRPAMPAPGPARPALPAPGPAALDPGSREEVPAAPRDRPGSHVTAEARAPSVWFSPGRAASDTGFSDTEFHDTAAGDTGSGPAAAGGSRPGLPRRARGTNLAPQLRAKIGAAAPTASQGGRAPARPGSPGSPAAAEPPARSPEEAGSLLSALQGGWERARIQDLDDFDGEEHR
jgi:signal transduction histidine kinase